MLKVSETALPACHTVADNGQTQASKHAKITNTHTDYNNTKDTPARILQPRGQLLSARARLGT